MSKVVPLIMFGLAFVVGGLYWALWNDSYGYLDSILIEDKYYSLIDFGWRMIPPVILFIGIMCLIAAGITAHRYRTVEY